MATHKTKMEIKPHFFLKTIQTQKHILSEEIKFFFFVGTLAKVRKAAITFVMFVCQSVRPHKTTRLPLLQRLAKGKSNWFGEGKHS
jgi:hypothetical protein